jgi:hypothetical protein
VIDGEAIVRGVDGYSDFNALHSGKHNEEVELLAFDILALDGDDLRKLPLSMRKANLQRLLARRPDGIFVSDFEQGGIGPDLFRKAYECALSSTARQLFVALTATPISTSCTPATTRPNRNLLTIVPNIGRKLPVIPVFFPDHNILAGHILWV